MVSLTVPVVATGTVSGITLTGGPITTTGTITLGGTLDLSSPPAIGLTTANQGKFSQLSVTGTAGSYVSNTSAFPFLFYGPQTGNVNYLAVSVNDTSGIAELIATNNTTPSASGMILQAGTPTGKTNLLLSDGGEVKFASGSKGQTAGFPWIPSTAGTPGTPSSVYPANAAMFYDTQTDSLWIYNSATPGWRTVSVGPSYLEARAASTQTIPNATDTIVAIDTADTNTSDITLSGDTNYQFLNNTGGTIVATISYQVSWNSSGPTTGAYATWIAINGDLATNRFGMQNQGFNASDYNCQAGTATLTLNNGDYFQIWCWQNSGATAGINGAGSGMTSGYSTKLTVVVH